MKMSKYQFICEQYIEGFVEVIVGAYHRIRSNSRPAIHTQGEVHALARASGMHLFLLVMPLAFSHCSFNDRFSYRFNQYLGGTRKFQS